MESGQNISRKKVVGKISEFVKIFNQEPASKPRDVVDLENDSSTRKQEEAAVNKISKDEKPKLNNSTDVSIKVLNYEKLTISRKYEPLSFTPLKIRICKTKIFLMDLNFESL